MGIGHEELALLPIHEAIIQYLLINHSQSHAYCQQLRGRAGEKCQFTLTSDRRGHTFEAESLGLDVVVPTGATQSIDSEMRLRLAAGPAVD